jgi:hypothetical protein
MKFCISFGKFELKYFFYCVLLSILELYIHFFFYYKEEEETIISEHCLMYLFCFFLGYLFNIIPNWISHIKSKEKEKPITNKLNEKRNNSIEYIYNKQDEKYLSAKDIIKFLFICHILLLAELIENAGNRIDDTIAEKEASDEAKNIDNKYEDNYIFIECIIIFLVSKCSKEVYYKHQYISFFIFILFGAIKNIYFLMKNLAYDFNIISFFSRIIYSIFYGIYYLYIKRLMNNKFISPYKCNFMTGIINAPLIIIIYFIVSLTPLGNYKSEYYFDNIFIFFNKVKKSNAKSVIKLISLPIVYGIYQFIVIKTIYDYSIFHMYIPFLIEYFLENITKDFNMIEKSFLIVSLFIELIMILVFIEIIEINCCGLNKNLKRNIQSRGIIDSSLNFEDDDDDETNYVRNDEENEIINSKF